MGAVQRVRFERPPVREVTLTLYFMPIEPLRVGHLADLRGRWRADYPRVDEFAPLPRWSSGDRSSVEYVSPNSPWPFPNVWFGGEVNDRAIKIQEDRFTLTWRFGADPAAKREYPGYDSLKPELTRLFGDFKDVLKQELDVEPEVTRVELVYDNVLADTRAPALLAHLVGGEANTASSNKLAGTDYCGVRFHYCASPENDDCSIMVGIDSDDSENETNLFLQVSRDLKDGLEQASATDIAHDVLIRAFLELVPDSIRQDWGPVDE